MPRSGKSALHEDLLDLLIEGADPLRLRSFQLSEALQERLDSLLDKNREGDLTEQDRTELNAYQQVEHVVRLLKARLAQRSN